MKTGRRVCLLVFAPLVVLALSPVFALAQALPEVACPNCDDFNPCTADSCDTTTGFCRHDPVVCDDANSCTTDSCAPAQGCEFAPRPLGTACDDGNPCSQADTCTGESQRVCTGSLLPPGTSCDDGNACTLSEFCTAEGQCLGASLSPGSDCDDQNACTSADACVESLPGSGNVTCQGLPQSCDDGNPCTQDSCDPASGSCGTVPANCDDGNPCTLDACNATGGGCVHTAQSAACSDGRFCAVGDFCSSGNCVATGPRNCSDGIPCTTDLCSESLDRCTWIPENNLCPPSTACVLMECLVDSGCVGRPLTGPSCSDNNVCTTGDACSNGLCTGAPLNCDDASVCTTEVCSSLGGCVYFNVSCSDGNDCTLDTCDAVLGCANPPLTGTPCSDGNPCTADVCMSGACQSSVTPLAITAAVSPTALKSGGHKMVTIHATVNAVTSCAGGPGITLVSITSDEPDDAPGPSDGNTVNDIQGASIGTADFEFQLRAEADRNGDGRTYTVVYQATDSSGASATASASVMVPKKGNQGRVILEVEPKPKGGPPQRD